MRGRSVVYEHGPLPGVAPEPGPEPAILAAEERAALIVTGSRGFGAIRASVSACLARHCTPR